MTVLSEFSLIEKYFTHLTDSRSDVLIGSGDDGAALEVPEDQLLVTTTDTLVINVHFDKDVDPVTLGHKVLAVNLSDLAAMGAEPAWVLLSLTLPAIDESWLKGFCKGFAALADEYGIQLVGGDITHGALCVTVQAMGFCPKEKIITRRGAKVGDNIYVTGHLGDGGGALQLYQQEKVVPVPLMEALQQPIPRIAEGLLLRGNASAAIDISDGLLADLNHLLKASGVGALVEEAHIPISTLLKEHVDSAWARELAFTAGDDYELCFTVSPEKEEILLDSLKQSSVKITRIGKIIEGYELTVLDVNGNPMPLPNYQGYEHF